jgi:hypothetical protein
MWFGHGLGPFGHTQPGGLGPALTMVPTLENFCHAIGMTDTFKLAVVLFKIGCEIVHKNDINHIVST